MTVVTAKDTSRLAPGEDIVLHLERGTYRFDPRDGVIDFARIVDASTRERMTEILEQVAASANQTVEEITRVPFTLEAVPTPEGRVGQIAPQAYKFCWKVIYVYDGYDDVIRIYRIPSICKA